MLLRIIFIVVLCITLGATPAFAQEDDPPESSTEEATDEEATDEESTDEEEGTSTTGLLFIAALLIGTVVVFVGLAYGALTGRGGPSKNTSFQEELAETRTPKEDPRGWRDE